MTAPRPRLAAKQSGARRISVRCPIGGATLDGTMRGTTTLEAVLTVTREEADRVNALVEETVDRDAVATVWDQTSQRLWHVVRFSGVGLVGMIAAAMPSAEGGWAE